MVDGESHRPQFTIKDLEFDMEPCTRTQFGPMGPKVQTQKVDQIRRPFGQPPLMPPLPSTYDDDTKGLIASVQRREKDISGFQIPRLRECRGPLSTQQDLAAELREDLDVLSRQIEVSLPLITTLENH